MKNTNLFSNSLKTDVLQTSCNSRTFARLLRYVTTLTLLLTLAIGSACAAVPSGWSEVTSLSGIAAGDKIIIVTNDGSKYLNGSVSSGHFSTTTLSASAPASTSAAGVIELVYVKADTYKLKFVSTSKYATATAASSGNAKIDAASDSYGWTFSYSSGFNARYQETGKQAYMRSYNNATFRTYSTTSSGATFKIYKYSATTHTLSSAVTPAASGSVSLSATSVAEGSTATATATPATHYTFSSWSISGTGSSLSSTSTNPTTVTMGTANATVTATFTAVPKASITLSEAGATTTDATTYYVGDTYTLPTTTSASCGTKVLVGWSTVTVPETNTKPSSNFYEKGANVTLVASQTFYAVFATASGGGAPTAYTAGDEGTFVLAANVSGTWYALPTNPTVSSGKIAGVSITVNTSGGVDYVTTANASGYEWTIADATNGQTISDGSKYIYHSNGGSSGTNLAYGNGTTYTWTIASETGGLTFQGTEGATVRTRGMLVSGTQFGGYALSNEGSSGFYRIHVLPISDGTTYSAYSTTCAASHTVSSAVNPTGKATVTLGATSVAEGSTTTATYSAITAGYEFVNWTISGTGANLSSTTANPTTITMGTGDVTVTANLQCITPSISVQPAASTTCLVGATPSLSVTAAAGGASLSYQWKQCATVDGEYSNVASNGTSSTYSPSTASAGTTYYKCVVTNAASGCSTNETSDAAQVTVNAPSGWKFKYSGDSWEEHTMNESAGVASCSISLAADSRFEFGIDDNGAAFYKNNGTIITTTSGWVFNTSDGNCHILTGPAGTYTFAINTTTKAVTVTYPSVTHPNEHYVYFKNSDVWGTVYGYLANSGNDNKAATWPGSVMSATTTICGETYHYAALNAMSGTYNTIIFNNGNSGYGNQTSDLSTTGSLGKYNANRDAAWHQFKYTISYAAGTGGSGSMSSHTDLCPGSNQALSANSFTKGHYHFTGWVADVDVTINSATVTAGTLITGTPTIQNVQSDITLTAQWEINSNTLTWNWGGGSTSSTSYTLYPATSGAVNYGTAITKPANGTMSKTGYTFSSWSSNATTMPDEALTITANWTAKTTSITLNKNNSDASGSTAGSTSYVYDQTANSSFTAATRTGYNVSGYYTATSDGTKILNADGSLAGNNITVDAVVYANSGKWAYDGTSLTLYAQWTAKTTTVSFNQNGGTGGQTTTKTATYSQAMPTPITVPTKAGYTFTGYYENSGGTGTKYYNADGSSATNWNKENATWTLYAGWTAKTDTYKTALHTSAAGWTSYASGYTTGTSGAGYTIPNPGSVAKGVGAGCEDTHYHFAGWVTDANKEAGTISGNIIPATGTTDATGTTYWAVWEKEAAGGGSLTKLTSSYVPTEGDNLVIVEPNGSYALYQETSGTYVAYWSFSNSVATVGADDKNYVTLVSDRVSGWYFGDATNGYVYNGSSNNLIVDASSHTSFTITWNSTGFNIVGNSRWLSCRTDVTTPNTNKYRMGGATSGSASGSVLFDLYKYVGVSYENPKAVCEDCVETPSITSVSLTGSAFSTTSVPVQATGASAGTNCSLTSYGFYWGTSANPSTNNTTSNNLSTGTFSATLTGPFTIGTTYYYRAYATNEGDNTDYSSDGTFTLQNVSFNMHGHGGGAPATQVVPQGGKATNPGNPSEAGCTFGGWYDNDSYTGSAWDFSTNTVGSGGVTLHAKWTEKPKYTITLNAGNGTISDVNWTNTSGSTYTRTQANGDEEITLPTPSCNCAGWVFQGWSSTSKDNAASFTPDKTDGASFTPASNVTYYAVYRQNSTGGTTYSKITNTGDLTTGNYIFMSSTGYAMKNVVTSSRMDEAGGYTASYSSQTIDNANLVWTIAKFSSQVVIKNGSYYLGIDANNDICLTTTPHFFTYTYNAGSSRWEFTSATLTSYQLIYNSYFKIGTSQTTAIYLYKQGAGLTGNYYTNPSCSDITVTGTVSPAGSGTVTLTAGSGNTGEKVYALYTPDEDYNFNGWSISGTGSTLGSTTDVVTEITIGTANTTVTANFVAKDWKTITWKAHGNVLTGGNLGSASVKVENGFDITALPPTPTSCDGTSTTFMGWVEESDVWSGKTDNVSNVTIYKKVSDFPTVTGNVTYHAVWARRSGSAAPDTYAGTGVFTKITTLDELEIGAHYVLYGIEDANPTTVCGAVNNTFINETSNKNVFGASAVTISDNKITNPPTTVVWKLGGTTNAYTLYSQNSSKYIEITADDTRGYTNPSSATTSFTISVSEGDFKIISNAYSRMITIYKNTNNTLVFRSYSSITEGHTLNLYKYGNNYTYDQYLVGVVEGPTGLAVSNVTYNSATISWTAVGDADHYDVTVYGKTSGGDESYNETYEDITSTSVVATGLTAGCTYEYYVTVTNSCGKKGDSDIGEFTTQYSVTYHSATEGDYVVGVASGGSVPAHGTDDCDNGKVLVGWTSAAVTSLQQTSPTIVTTDGSLDDVDANTTLYAVFASRNGGKVTGTHTLTEDFESYTANMNYGNAGLTFNNANGLQWLIDYGNVTTTGAGKFGVTNVNDVALSPYQRYQHIGMETCLKLQSGVEDLQGISIWASKDASAISGKLYWSANGTVWTDENSKDLTLLTTTSSYNTIQTFVNPQTLYFKICATDLNPQSGTRYLYIDNITLTIAEHSYYYTDYSTTCETASAPVAITWDEVEGSTIETGTEPATSALGNLLVLPTLSKDNYRFDGWKVTLDGDEKADVYLGGETFLINHPVTFTAQWTQVFEVSDPETGVTSYKDIATTSEPFSMTVKDTHSITPVVDGLSDDTHFAVTISTPGTDDGDDTNFTYTFTYTPDDFGTGSGAATHTATFRFKDETSGVVSEEVTIRGRSLPETFIIAVKNNDKWYALPGDLQNTSAQPSIVPVEIMVNDATTPTSALLAPQTALYKAANRYQNTHTTTLRFTTTSSNWLQVSGVEGTFNMWLSNTGGTDVQDWQLHSTDFNAYELTIPSHAYPTKKMGIYNGSYIGYHTSPSNSRIYLLPAEEEYTPRDAKVKEWGRYAVVVEVATTGIATVKAHIDNDAPTSALTPQPVNVATIAGAKNLMVNTAGAIDFSAQEGHSLYLDWYDSSDALIATSQISVPLIIAEDKTMSSIDAVKTHWEKKEVHVLPGVKLTADANTYASGNVSVKTLEVYPNATLHVSAGTLNTTDLHLRCGWTRANGKDYDVARVFIDPSAALTKTHAAMHYDIFDSEEGKHYYPLAVPFSTPVSTIDYADEYLAGFSTYGTHYVIKDYDGASRAENGDIDENWTVVASDGTLQPGHGYIITAVAVKGEALIRIPLNFDNAWTSAGEKASIDAVTKNVVPVVAHTGTASTGESANNRRHAGWNILGVPFMSCYTAGTDMYAADALIKGEIVIVGGSEGFAYENTTVPYVSVPTHNFAEYIQTDITEAKLLPGWSFFVQVGTGGNLTFSVAKQRTDSDTPLYAPQRNDDEHTTVRAALVLAGNGSKDKTTLIIGDRYEAASYEIGADLEKMFGNGYTLATYTVMDDGTRLVFNALNLGDIANSVPVGFRAPDTGEYTFALDDTYPTDRFERLDLIDYKEGTLTNLLKNDYKFTTDRTQDDSRFALNVVMRREPMIPTATDDVTGTGSNAEKRIVDGCLIIIRNGRIYDATGKLKVTNAE